MDGSEPPKPEKDPWATAKWTSTRPQQKATVGTRIMAAAVMAVLGGIAGFVVGSWLFMRVARRASLGNVVLVLIGACTILGVVGGVVSVLVAWPKEDD